MKTSMNERNTAALSRRDLLRAGAVAGLAGPLLSTMGNGNAEAADVPVPQGGGVKGDPWHGLKIGVASYTLLKLPREQAIKAIQRVGLKYCSIKDSHMPMKTTAEERKAIAQEFVTAGITPLSCGNITMYTRPESMRTAFEYARDAGIPTIVCRPDPSTMAALDALVKEFNIRLAIHNHGPSEKEYPTPHEVWKMVEKYDPRIGLCIDVGHTARGGADPADCIRKYHERLYDVHLKDIHQLAPNGRPIEVGRGALDIKGILTALIEVKFAGDVGFEYEKDAADPLPGLAESVGYVRGVLA
jgi:inosose dehydratase